MIVIADSSPLRYLILVQEVHLLATLFGIIVIPPGVLSELTRPSTPDPVRIWMEHLPEWVKVKSPGIPLPIFSTSLDQGEREAIALAEELAADVLLADDGAARREAAQRNIPVQGTLGILDLAAEHDLVNFSEAIRKLAQTNFRAGGKLIQFFTDRDALRNKRKLEQRNRSV
jgi:predicted nucleic acid-binding protein